MRTVLAGISPGDPVTYAAGIALAAVMVFAGSLLPALRAAKVDPIVAIRSE